MMDSILKKRREIFFNNLLLLGFDIKSAERGSGIPFNKDMFVLPNKKGFEAVTHFLFSKLNEITQDEFKITWPILDKKMEQEFRKTCFTYLTKIAKETVNGVQFPRIYQTLLTSAGGDRFYELYIAFSTYVMQRYIDDSKTFQRLYFCPTKDKKLQDLQTKSLRISTAISTREFIDAQKIASEHQEQFEKASEDFVAYYRHTKQKLAQLVIQKQEALDELYSQCFNGGDEIPTNSVEKYESATMEKDKELEKVLLIWKTIEEHLSCESELWNIVRTELDSEPNEKVMLDGHKYINISVPEILRTHYIKDLQDKKVQCLTENGKLSLKNFLNLWLVCLKHYIESFEKESLPSTESLKPTMRENIEQLETYLKIINLLSEKLTSIIKEAMGNVERLEKNAYSTNGDNLPDGFPPFTPPLTFTPKNRSNSSVFPEHFLTLTPSASKKTGFTRRSSLQGSSISPLHFNVLNYSTSPGENRGHLNASCKISGKRPIEKLPTSRIPRLDHHIVSHSTDERSLPANQVLPSELSEAFSNLNVKRESNSCKQDFLALTDDQAFNDMDSKCSFLTESSSHSVVTDFETSEIRLDMGTLANVKRKLVEQVISEFAYDDSGACLLHDESVETENLVVSPGVLGQSAFQKKDNIYRSPDAKHFNFNAESVKKIAQLSRHLRSEDGKLSEGKHLHFMSFSGEEMLDDITLPSIPFF